MYTTTSPVPRPTNAENTQVCELALTCTYIDMFLKRKVIPKDSLIGQYGTSLEAIM